MKVIGLQVSSDPLALVVGVRFHVAGQPDAHADLVHGGATREVDAEEVSWWAELIGERDAQLEVLGSAEQPIVEHGVDLIPQDTAPAPAPVSRRTKGPGRAPRLRTGAFIAGGVGAASSHRRLRVRGAVGLAHRPAQGRHARQQRSSDQPDASAGVRARLPGAHRDAILANSLLGVGGALLALALALFLAGGS